MIPVPFRVERTRRETYDTFTLELVSVEGKDGFPFLPGQFNMLYPFGMGEVPISISGNPGDPRRLVHTIREVGAVTNALRKLRQGDVLGVRGPFGGSWPVQEAEGNDLVVVAGGIGLAPLRPVLYQVLSRREKFGRVYLLYGARTPRDLLFKRELETWRARFDFEVQVTVDHAAGGWRGNVGVVTTLLSKAHFDPINTVAMVCGPEIMMRFTVLELRSRGLDLAGIYISMERNMKCGIGLCGHCQFGPHFICKDGPVFRFDRIRDLFAKREI
jgi:NAD(P)H-flavin reductase